MAGFIDAGIGKTKANDLCFRDVRPHDTRFIAGNENRVGTVLGNVNYNISTLDLKDLLRLTNARCQDTMPLSILKGVKGILDALQKQMEEMHDGIAESSKMSTQSFKVLKDKLETTMTEIDEQVRQFDKPDNEKQKQDTGLGEHTNVVSLARGKQSELESIEGTCGSNNMKDRVNMHMTRSSENSSMSTPKRRKAPAPPKYFSIKRALYDFQAAGDNELSLVEGDILAVVDESTELTRDGWCKARLRGTDYAGLVPISYLEPTKTHHRFQS